MIDHQQMDRINYSEQLQTLQERIKGLEFDLSKLKTAPREVRRVVEDKEVINEPIKVVETETRKPLVIVSDVERLLQNGNLGRKELLMKGWERLPQIKDAKLQAAAMLLHEGKLVAATDKEILLVYPDKINCQMMMKPTTKNLVFEILNSKTKLIENYICIDEDAWQILFSSFAKQWREGNKKPTLPKMDLGLYEELEESWQPGSVSLAIDFFGKDKVMIKE